MMGHGQISLQEPHWPRGLTALRELDFAVMWHLRIQVIGQLTSLCQDIAQGKGLAISNGPFKDSNGVAAWIIEGSDGLHRLQQGTCLTPGAPDDHSAFQSKLTGLYGILLTLRYLFPDNDFSTTIIIVCNGQSALTWVKATDPLLPSEPHYNLISAI